MQADLRRATAFLVLALLSGLASGQLLAGLLIAAAGYAAWSHWRLRQLLDWLRDRKAHPAPDVPGVFEAICSEIDFLRTRHRRRKRRLATLLKQFEDATSALPDATVMLGPEGEIRWANVAAQDQLGIRWPDDRRQRLTNLLRHPDVAALLESETAADTSVDIPSPIDPGLRLSLRLAPCAEDMRLFLARDVTRMHRMGQMRSDFLANVSHELRTPLTVVSGYLQTLRAQERQCPEAWKPVLSQMQAQTDRMTSMIRDLLLVSRLENEPSTLPGERVCVPEMLRRIHGEAQTLSGDRRHLFALEADPTLHLLGSESELYSAFSNLVTNAVQYTPPRGFIRIRWYGDGAGAHFAVEDNGIGIPDLHLPRITERFYRAEAGRSRHSGGTGLGLSIVKHVLHRHAATLHIESVIGKGSLFRCDFPPGRVVGAEQAESA
ncbi:MAG: Phosphate regulon sensor protein PhoR [Gammaproteobacteria bacterium]|nr:Phosphate regulon sensor protein PhoR [Gammaproteobacteria bacterium]